MISRCRQRLPDSGIEFVESNLFAWSPDRSYDFAFWLSRVPSARFEAFWLTVKAARRPGGRVFFVDSRHCETSTASDHQLPPADQATLTRKLNDGREFRISQGLPPTREARGALAGARVLALRASDPAVFHLRGGLSP
ncbi:MAG: hypothetical protein VCA73_11115 [Roseibacillus sp.]